MSDFITAPDETRLVLDRLKIAARTHVGAYVAANMEIERWADHLTDTLVFQLRSEVLAKTLSTQAIQKSLEFDHPATTWQMFKKTHEGGRWLGWIARRWPVRYETTKKWVTVEQQSRVAFPDATIRFPDTLGRPVYFEALV